MKSLEKNIVLNVFRTLMSLIFPLITFPYASRVLNPELIGKVNFASSIISYFSMFAALGISAYAIREASKLRDNKVLLSKFTQEILSINLISTIIAYIALYVCIFFLPVLFPYRKLLIIISSSILFSTFGVEWLYTAQEDFTYITIRSFIFQILSIIALFIFVKNENDYLKYAAISVFANVGSNICNFINVRKYINFKIRGKLNLHQHIKPIFGLFALVITSSIYQVLDTSMVGFLANNYHVGLYSAATKINRMVLSLVVSMGAVLLPRLSYYAGNENKEKFIELAYKYIEIVILIALPCVVGLSLLSRPVLLILSGEKYIEAIPVMRMMNPIILILGISNFTGVQLFLPLRKEKWTLYSDICGAIVNFTLNFILIPKYFSMGAAIATVCAECVVTGVQLFLARKIISLKTIFCLSVKYVVFSIIMGIPVYICVMIIDNTILQLVISVLCGIIIYFIMLLLTKNPIIYEVVNRIKSRLKH